jgi:predicted Zn finger-like uncharacterized protein
MIVTCPGCDSKYFVQTEAIGGGKMVRCAICSTTWQQVATDEAADRKFHTHHIIKWTFFWFTVFVSIFSLFFTSGIVLKIWPPAACFYDLIGVNHQDAKKMISIQNISNFFVQKNGKLYMGLKGELTNISGDVQVLPSLTISLRNDEYIDEKIHRSAYQKIWTHDLMYNKLLPNQKVVFETELQSVPCNNLICDIRLNVL